MLRIGLIGTGNRGRAYIKEISDVVPPAGIVAVCDFDIKKVTAASRAFSIPKTYTDYNEMFENEKLDGCIICTPDFTHKEITLAALNKDMHVLCEKPMALTLKDCLEMEKNATVREKYITLGFVLRYNRFYETMKGLLNQGHIGKLIQVIAMDSVCRGGEFYFHDWHRNFKNTGGLLLQKAVHSIDIVNWMVDSRPEKVYALGGLDYFGGEEDNDKRCYNCSEKNTCKEYLDRDQLAIDFGEGLKIPWEDKCVFAREVDVNDNEQVSIFYENHVRALYNLCQITPDYKREFILLGDKGRIYGKETYVPQYSCEIHVSPRWSQEEKVIYPASIWGGHGGGDTGVVKDFLQSIKENKKPLADGWTGILSTAVTSAAYESMKTGMPVSIKF